MAKNGNIHPTRTFKTVTDLETAWNDYKVDLALQSNEWKKFQYVGKEGNRVEDGLKVPKTLEGFQRFCREKKICNNVWQYFGNKDDYYNDFVDICMHIKMEIREDQIIGGLLGFYNPSITQRLNALVENVNTNPIEVPLFPDVDVQENNDDK